MVDGQGELTLDASDFIGEARDAEDSMDDMGATAEETQDQLFEFDAVGAAISGAAVGAGAGLDQMQQSTRGVREDIARLGQNTDMTEDEITDLTTSMTDATFSQEEAVGAMRELQGLGVDTAEDMERYAVAMDTIGDATGSSADAIGQSLAPQVNALDGDLDGLEDNMDAFVFAAENSSLSIEDIGNNLGQLDFEPLREMGVSSDEAALAMAEFADKTGLPPRQLRTQFRQAVEESDGDIQNFEENLGFTEGTLEELTDEVDANAGMAQRQAEAVGEQASTMDELRARADDTMLSMSNMLGPVEALSPVLMSAGSAGMFLSTVNVGSVVPSATAAAGSLWAMLAPLWPLIAVVAILAAAWKMDFLGIQDVTAEVLDFIRDQIFGFVDIIGDLWDRFGDDILQTGQMVFETLELVVGTALTALLDVILFVVDQMLTAWDMWGDDIIAVATTTADVFRGILTVARDVFGAVADVFRDVTAAVLDIVGPFLDLLSDWWEENGDTIRTEVADTLEAVRGHFDTVMDAIMAIVGPVVGFLSDVWTALMGDLTDSTQGGMGTVGDVIGATMDAIRTVFDVVTDSISVIWDVFGDHILTVIEFATDAILTAVEIALDNLLNVFLIITGIIQGDWEQVWGALYDLTVGTAADILGFARDWGGRLLGFFTGLVRDIIGRFMDLARSLIGGSIIPNMLNSILGAVGDFIFDMRGRIRDLRRQVLGQFSDLRDGAVAWIDDLVDTVIGSVRGLVDDVLGLAGDFKDAGTNLISSMTDGVKDAIPDLGDSVSDAADAARDKLPFSPAKEGPLADLDEAGPALIETLVSGVQSEEGRLDDILRGLGVGSGGSGVNIDALEPGDIADGFDGSDNANDMVRLLGDLLREVKRLRRDWREADKDDVDPF